MAVQSWTQVVVGSFAALWVEFMAYVPRIIGALIVLIIGLIVAAGLDALVERIFESMKLDTFLEKIGLKPIFERAGLRIRGAYFLGKLVYWFVVLGFLLAIADTLGLYALSGFLTSVVDYIPNVIAAVLILLAAFVVGHFLRRIVTASVLSAKLHGAHFLGTFTWWIVVVFGFLAALSQLDIASQIVQTIVTGFIAMLALAGGLAFGLGGRDYAHHMLDKLKDRTEPH